jgi:hypothetical protein
MLSKTFGDKSAWAVGSESELYRILFAFVKNFFCGQPNTKGNNILGESSHRGGLTGMSHG